MAHVYIKFLHRLYNFIHYVVNGVSLIHPSIPIYFFPTVVWKAAGEAAEGVAGGVAGEAAGGAAAPATAMAAAAWDKSPINLATASVWRLI